METNAGLSWIAAVSVALSAIGCAPERGLPPEVAHAEREIGTAEDFGATDQPSAAVYLGLARRGLALARAAAARGDVDVARRSALRAEADAQLATAIAREASVRQAAERSAAEAAALADELAR